MFLKKIEIYGFKSFAEKATMDLSGGISAIIGPNGCGKSNIVDAVRWVLGEQSAKTLRGSRMEDIIFSGSNKRKPLNFAEVNLVFSDVDKSMNLDFSEMSITRRLYRSGESEFFINKTSCRLKDISELFMDTGIGKEVYSIVGQNRVEEIISVKPEDRRELIEEAAGILKYKIRKRETRKKLDDMKLNLQRVSDLVCEMENQMDPLKEQAEIAGKYRALKADIRENEFLILSHRISTSENLNEKITSKTASLKDEKINNISILAKITTEIENNQRVIDEKKDKKAELTENLNYFIREKEMIENRIVVLEEKEKNIAAQEKNNRERAERLAKSSVEISESIRLQRNDCQEKEKTADNVEEEIAILNEKTANLKKDDTLLLMEKLQSELTENSSRHEGMESTIAEIEKRNSETASMILNNEKRKEEEGLKLEKIIVQTKVLVDNSKEKRNLYSRIEKDIELTENKLADNKGIKENLKEKNFSLQEEISSLENKLWLLREIQKEKDPLREGSDELLKDNKEIKGIIGSLYNVINVPLSLSTAIETVLGEKFFGVITENDTSALIAVNHLKENSKGWSTLFPLNVMGKNKTGTKDNYSEADFTKIKGYIGIASQLIQFDKKYKNIVENILSNIHICENLNAAVNLASKADYNVYAVTVEGDLVYPGGAIRGGKVSQKTLSPHNVEKDINAIILSLEKLTKQKVEVDSNLSDTINKERILFSQEAELRKRKDDINREIVLIEKDTALLEKEKEHTENILNGIKELLDNSINDKKELEERKKNILRDITDCEKLKSTLHQRLIDMKNQHSNLLQENERVTNQLTNRKIEFNKIKEQVIFIRETIKRAENEMVSIEKEIKGLNNEDEIFSEKIVQIKNSYKDEEKAKELLARDSKQKTLEYEALQRDLGTLVASDTELRKKEENIKNRLQRLERQEHKYEIELTRIEAENEHQINLFREKFGDLSQKNDFTDDFNEEELLDKIKNINDEINKMGHVRIGAIEELERLNDRVVFLKEQEDDLKKGEQSLKEILEEIEMRIKDRFLQTMEEIKAHFKDLFRDFFGGGEAILKFTDDENILESGIDIEVQPPGKNLKNITLLSSGEKTLTAIALVFAIFRYKPAPFYFLDEIESSLDDSNLNRFIDYLERAAEKAQFILITHRKNTMEKADLVYGVTMPESGVSKIISMKLNQKVS